MRSNLTMASLAILAAMMFAPSLATAESDGDKYVKSLQALVESVVPPDYTSIQGVPSGGISPRGYVSLGVAITSKETDGGIGGLDGSMSTTVGLGELFGGIGTEITSNITSVDPNDFGDSGSFGVKFGAAIDTADQPINVGLSFDNFGRWGDSKTAKLLTTLAISSRATRYMEGGGAFSYAWTVGGKLLNDNGGEESAFAGISIGLTENLSLSTAHDTGTDDTKLGVGIKLFDSLSISVTAVDPFNTGEGQGISVGLGVSALVF
jgi:hypothetical protein